MMIRFMFVNLDEVDVVGIILRGFYCFLDVERKLGFILGPLQRGFDLSVCGCELAAFGVVCS